MKDDRQRQGVALPRKAEDILVQERMLPDGAAVLAALSGGADSMALLHFFKERQEILGLSGLFAAHLNHRLRGAESDRDEAFVRTVCKEWGIPLTVERADVGALAAGGAEGLEAAGRRARYAFLRRTAEKLAEQTGGRAVRIATAHTLSDQWETILLHLTRGSGLRGLCGIAPVRDAVIRPLLDCTRAEVEDYCRANGIPFITDSTNADERYSRNRIRHTVVPILSELNPRGAQAAGRTARLLREDADYLDGLARQAERKVRRADGAYDAAALRGLPPALRGRVLRRLAGTSEGEDPLHDLDAETVGRLERLLDSERGGVNLPGGRTVLLAAGQLTIRVSPVDFGEVSLPLPRDGGCIFCGRTVRVCILPKTVLDRRREAALSAAEEAGEDVKKIYNFVLQNTCDYDMIKNNVILRNRRAGDAFRPAGRGVTKSLKKLWNEKRLPPEKRAAVPLVCDEDGILLVGGFGCDERARVTDSTDRVLLLLDAAAVGNLNINASFFEGIGEA